MLNSWIFFSCQLLTIILIYKIPVDSECVCNVEFNGEYCGTELNKINRNNDCQKHQYLCGDSNRNKSAVIVKLCMNGSECDVIKKGGNACLEDIECECGSDLRQGPRYCGNRLKGRDCSKDVVFTCGSSYPNPVDACVYGCRNGKCLSRKVQQKPKTCFD